jgi:hypothetical protein
MFGLQHLILLVRILIEDRQQLALENVALRHQLAVLKRSVKRPKIQDSDRMFCATLRASGCPATVVAGGSVVTRAAFSEGTGS